MSMHEQGIMAMFMDTSSSISSSSSSTMQAMTLSHVIEPLPMLMTAPACMTQVGMGGHELYEDYRILGGDIGVEGELFIPPLENISIEDNAKAENMFNRNINNNPINNMNCTINPCTNNSNIKVGDMNGVGHYWEGEELRIGEWDLEELMRDVSTFPNILDFQVQ